MSTVTIVPVVPFADGVEAGNKLGARKVRADIAALLKHQHLRENLGAMSRAALAAYVQARLETEPDYARYPELADIYPERLDFLRGFAKGAGCPLSEAATLDFLRNKALIETWYHSLQLQPGESRCSAALLVGPDGVLGAQSAESEPPPRPKAWRWRAPRPYAGLRRLRPARPDLVLRKPRTGYIEGWGTTNERGVAACAGVSCSTWLDDPIEDTWPIVGFPLLRFARSIEHLVELYTRYTLHVWGRANQLWADTTGDAVVVEKSFRRIGIRRLGNAHALWCTEGHFETPEMHAFIRERRLAYVAKMGRHLGADDLQYATDCHVRFTHLGELCHKPWGRGYDHMRRILTDHATFPRAVCRHGGPDTDPYDTSVTMLSTMVDLTHNRAFSREWIPWKKFPCEMPERVTQYPARPCGGPAA